ncbi:hypothetical protein J2W56_002861 [Nocardia kruczakiae]|uniref:MmyB-like transcription regulator ligand binding domain-containing protein n=1 Tax=Nocardia kruczakiae TaxID=261477 RepID=A0ABU1XF01_9NOCA|nr:DUF5994 family protein [Nocardia kruczakiae]MDR7169120.1 hypothetical protein [Nocardia kruczakiae]
MAIAHTFAHKTKAFPEAIRRYLDPLPERAASAPAEPSNRLREPAATRRPARLRLKPEDRHSAYIDGAWWPRSADLATELPELLAALTTRQVDRIVYDPDSWSPPPRQVTVGDHSISLEPYRFRLRNTMYVVGADSAVTVLRVILPSADRQTAYRAMVDAVAPQQE